jgi:hypothetical protein
MNSNTDTKGATMTLHYDTRETSDHIRESVCSDCGEPGIIVDRPDGEVVGTDGCVVAHADPAANWLLSGRKDGRDLGHLFCEDCADRTVETVYVEGPNGALEMVDVDVLDLHVGDVVPDGAIFVRWNCGGQDHDTDGYQPGDYIDAGGRYRGPDNCGIEAVFGVRC